MIWQAVHAGFGYFQREAAYTRTGSHNTRVHGRETGQWHEADLAVAHWLQHTSRRTATCSCTSILRSPTPPERPPTGNGGRRTPWATTSTSARSPRSCPSTWRKPSPRRFGLEWIARDDGHGFEIKGIPGEMMRLFPPAASPSPPTCAPAPRGSSSGTDASPPSASSRSSRRRRTSEHARPRRRARWISRRLHAGWADKLARTLGVSLASVAPSVWHAASVRAAAHAHGAEGTVLA